jgi:hypothetical protein
MHMVISNAHAAIPTDRCAVHVHGQHGLELVDEHSAVMKMLTDKDETAST